jgi:hypothetical protein
MLTATDLMDMSRAELMALLCAGHPIDASALDDTEYRGISLGLPHVVEQLTWKVFKKTFHRDPRTGALRGWNVRLEQRGVDAPCVPMRRGGEPRTFGHYEVVPATGRKMPAPAHAGLLIDYGRGRNGRLDAMSRVRDPIVAVNAGSADLLLGWSYVDLGFAQVGTPSFFSLERDSVLTHRVAPPRA